MLTAVDTSMIAFLRALFPEKIEATGKPKFTVVMAPAEGSRQALANYNKSATIGVPGLSVWRSDIAIDYERYNMPLAARGFPWARDEETKSYKFVKAIPVSAVYSVRAWARGLTDLTYMERKLAFCHIYKTLKATFKIDPNTDGHHLNWPLWAGDLDYEPIIANETGKVIFHSFKVDFEVDTWWVKEYPVPWIEEISVKFFEVLDGNPVEFGALEDIKIDLTDQFKERIPRVKDFKNSLQRQRTQFPQNGLAFNQTDPDFADQHGPAGCDDDEESDYINPGEDP